MLPVVLPSLIFDEMRSHVRDWVHPGFTPRDEVLAAAQEYRDGAEWALTDRQVELLVDEIWQARPAEQNEWPGDEPAHLFLAYGTLDPIRGQVAEQDEQVGRRIETALRAQGLPVEWTGSSQQRIAVGPITWRRRLPATG